MDSSFSWRSCRACENPVKTKTYWIFDYSFQILGLPQHIVSFFFGKRCTFKTPTILQHFPPISHITLGTPCFNQGCGLRPSATPEKVWDCTIFLCETVDGSEIRLSPVELGSLFPLFTGFVDTRTVVGCLGFQPSTL